MKKTEIAAPRKVGRPVSFDRADVLRMAMLKFWQHGYETTSIADLTEAVGLSAPSLYAAFGDKKQLFLEAMRLYAGDTQAMASAIRTAATAYAAARELLISAARGYTGTATPKGCLLASATASGSAASADVQRAVADVRAGIRGELRRRIQRDVASGVLPRGSDAAALAGLVMALTQGMSVLARDGASRGELLAIAEAGLRAWPGSPSSSALQPS